MLFLDWGMTTLKRPKADDALRWMSRTREPQDKYLGFIRAVRLSDTPGYVPTARVNINVKTWPIGESVTFAVYFDKEVKALRIVDRSFKDVSPPLSLAYMASHDAFRPLIALALSEGLVDRNDVPSKSGCPHSSAADLIVFCF